MNKRKAGPVNNKIIYTSIIVFLVISVSFIALKMFVKPADDTEFICGKPAMIPDLFPSGPDIENFQDCLLSGSKAEGFPWRKCERSDGKVFKESMIDRENIPGTNIAEITSISPNDKVDFPITLKGEAHEIWFTYGGFPVKLVSLKNDDYTVISSAIACPDGEKNTEGMIPFKLTIEGPAEQPDGQLYISLIRNDPKEIGQRKFIRSYPVSLN
jgi:hypothetical protein